MLQPLSGFRKEARRRPELASQIIACVKTKTLKKKKIHKKKMRSFRTMPLICTDCATSSFKHLYLHKVV